MWPKAFSQFIELAPHISRLLPLADRFLQSKTAAEDPGRRALETASATLKEDLGNVSAAQDGISRQITMVNESVVSCTNDIHSMTTAMEALATRFEASEGRDASSAARLSAIETRLSGIDTHLQRMGERVRLGPVVLLMVLTNLILLAAVIALLVRGR